MEIDSEVLVEVASTIAQALNISKDTFLDTVKVISEDIEEYTQVVAANMPEPMLDVFKGVAEQRTAEIRRLTHGESPELVEMIMNKYLTGTLLAGVVMAVYCMAAKFIEEQGDKEEKED